MPDFEVIERRLDSYFQVYLLGGPRGPSAVIDVLMVGLRAAVLHHHELVQKIERARRALETHELNDLNALSRIAELSADISARVSQ